MKSQPLVSVICLCYNQARWLRTAVQSVLDQTYPHVELILVDDGSSDQSATLMKDLYTQIRNAKLRLLEHNVGNCAAFNQGLAMATGEYVIDFAADDVMMPDRIARQVACFESLPADYGVVFTDAVYIDESGRVLRRHFEDLRRKGLLTVVPEGDVFPQVLSTYFIPSPTMMIRKTVLDRLGGYDEQLAYEDFDFWVRSSRLYRYAFLPQVLTQIRRSSSSMSSGWYRIGDRQLFSTYLVCEKALLLCRTDDDWRALKKRVRYELRQSVFSENRKEAGFFFHLLQKLHDVTVGDWMLRVIARTRLPLRYARAMYQRYWLGRRAGEGSKEQEASIGP